MPTYLCGYGEQRVQVVASNAFEAQEIGAKKLKAPMLKVVVELVSAENVAPARPESHEKILVDFRSWSGGFEPSEVSEEDREFYANDNEFEGISQSELRELLELD